MPKHLITLIALCFCAAASAQIFPQRPMPPPRPQRQQDTTKRDPPSFGTTYSLAIEPVFGFNDCIKTDLEVKPANHHFGIELTPEIYTGQTLNSHADDVSGFGIGLYHKLYIDDDARHPVMISTGATFRQVNVSYRDEGFIPYQQDGLQYLSYRNFSDVLKTRSVLTNITASARVANTEDVIYLDTYAGLGYKFSPSGSTYPGFREYNTNMYNYAYKGFVFLIGFKVGFLYHSKK